MSGLTCLIHLDFSNAHRNMVLQLFDDDNNELFDLQDTSRPSSKTTLGMTCYRWQACWFQGTIIRASIYTRETKNWDLMLGTGGFSGLLHNFDIPTGVVDGLIYVLWVYVLAGHGWRLALAASQHFSFILENDSQFVCDSNLLRSSQ